jgi:hypothetical protein
LTEGRSAQPGAIGAQAHAWAATKESIVEKIVARVKEEAKGGKLACKRAFELAEELGVGLREVGKAANEAGVKIAACQLGCFK